MGSFLSNEKTNDLELSPTMLTAESQHQTPIQLHTVNDQPNCCGMGASQKKTQSEVWRADFESCCNRLKQYFKWTEIVKREGVEKLSTRIECMKEFNELKYQFSRKLQNKQVPDSIQMRKLLCFSALLEQNVGEDGRMSSKSIISKSSFNFSVKSSMQNHNKFKGRPQHLMVSVFEQNMKTLFLPKKTTKFIDQEIESSVYLFVKFTELLQKQSQDPNNAICKIRLSFINYIRDTYGNQRVLTEKQDEQLTTSIQAFIDLYTITINVYYRVPTLSENEKTRYIFSIENIKSVATVILFKHDNFYQLVFKLYEQIDAQQTEQLKSIIAQKAHIKPQDLKVNPQYCLNEMTLNWHINKASLERNGLEEVDIPMHKQCQPFESCIIKLKQIGQGQTPISKLKVIISTAEKISSSISRFYEINGISSTQMVDADQVLTIFIYIIINSGISNLKTHLRFVENFCTQQQLLSETGYYSKVAESALKILLKDTDNFD